MAGAKPGYKHKSGHVGSVNKVNKHNGAAPNTDAVSQKKIGAGSPPTLSYKSPQALTLGQRTNIPPPTSTGVDPEAYSTTAVTIGSGFNAPYGVAVDVAGNVYIADKGNNAIKKIPAGGGAIVTLGSGFSGPTGVAVDDAGNVYVADRGHNLVKKIPVGGGTPVTLGSGFSSPTGVALDAAGNVYVADQGNNAVKEVLVRGGATVNLGSGFNAPTSVSVETNGNIFIVDAGNNAIKLIQANGELITYTSDPLAPVGIAVNSGGYVYLTDNIGAGVRELMIPDDEGYHNNGELEIGSGFDNPAGVAVDNAGNVYVADSGNNAVKKISPVGGYYLNFLPAGMAFEQSTGFFFTEGPTRLSPATNYTITAYNSFGSTSATLNISVSQLVFSYSGPQTYTAGTAITALAPVSNSGSTGVYSHNSPDTLGAGFNLPSGVAVDGAGNVYVADAGNNAVKKIPAGGGAPVTIGSGFNQPFAVAVDALGNVYVADEDNNAIKKIPVGGGSPITLGSGFSLPTGVAVDAPGNVYVADGGHNAVKEIPVGGGNIITLGSGFNDPAGVAVDNIGNIYVADSKNNAVKEIPVGGGAPVTLGSGFTTPMGVAVDLSGNVYVANTIEVREIINGVVSRISIPYGSATGVAVDGVGKVYIAAREHNSIQYETPSGGYFINALPVGLSFNSNTGVISGTPTEAFPSANCTVTTYNGSAIAMATLNITVNAPPTPFGYQSPQTYVTEEAIVPLTPTGSGVAAPHYSNSPIVQGSGFNIPAGIAVDATGNIYVADQNNNAVKKIPAGNGTPVSIGSGFLTPDGVAVDAAGNVYVADNGNNAVKKIPAGGGAVITLGSGFLSPHGVAVDAAGNVYVADEGNNAVKEIAAAGGAVITLGSGFKTPTGVAVDSYGNIYVADYGNNAIKKIPAGGGAVVTLASGFTAPTSVAVDGTGNVFLTDYGNHAVKEIQAGGGSFLTIGTEFTSLYGVAVDASNNVYISDYSTNAVEEIAPVGGYFISNGLPLGLGFSNTTGAISGTPTASSPATNYTVTGYNILGSKSAVVNIKVISNNANLANLTINNGTLNPAFAGATTVYSALVPDTLNAIQITPTSSDPLATVTVNGTSVPYAKAIVLPLTAGSNKFSIRVNATSGTTFKIYTLTISKPPVLSALTLSTGTLTPVFAGGTSVYTASVSNTTTAITVTPTVTISGATIKVNSVVVSSGTASAAIPLTVGPNTITILVTAQDGTTTQTYTVTVTRAPSSVATLSLLKLSNGAISPAFSSANSSYTASVANGVSSMTVTPTTTDPTATVKINGAAVSSGSASNPITLAEGAQTVITTLVTAQDGTTTKTYTVTITRAPSSNAGLSTLGQSAGGLSPAFSSATTSYTLNVSNAIATMTLKPVSSDANATIKVNGVAETSGTTTAPIGLVAGAQTVITTAVTAQDGTTTKTYILTVTRAQSTTATLSSLKLSNGTLSPAFTTAITSYTANVVNNVASITITPTATDRNATIKVNGSAVSSGGLSGSITIAEGANAVITTVVTAQDGVTTKTYTVTVTRAPSSNANLSTLGQSVGGLSPGFAAADTFYNDNVSNATASMTLKPVSSDANATIKVNGSTVTSGTITGPISLAVGPNTVTTVVTAQNGTTTKTYTLTVTRASGGADSYGLIAGGNSISITKPIETATLAEDGIVVHQGLSPNGDGINDFLQIDNISQYPDNKLMIMNRNGQLVFEVKGYDNSSKVFDGRSDKNGQMQLPGTYFYQLDYTVSGITRHKTGFIVLKY